MVMASDREDRVIIEKARERGVSHPMLDFLSSAHAFAARDYVLAAEYLGRARTKDPTSAELARFHVLALVLAGDEREADALVEELASTAPEDPRFSEWLARVRESTD